MADDDSNIIPFPLSSGTTTVFNKRQVTIEQYANLLIYDVITADGCRGLCIEGFSTKQESDAFLGELDDFFMDSINR